MKKVSLITFLFGKQIAKLKGRFGESFVSSKLNGLDLKHYKTLNDLMLLSQGNTNTTQIDHVVVSNHGIFCIETKDYSGWIFGSVYQKEWTQVIYRNKYRFYNPILQNYAHIKAVEAIVRPIYPTVAILGFVAFPSAEKLTIHGADNVGHTRDIVEKIKNINLQSLTDEDVNKVVEVLTKANITDIQLRKQHTLDTIALKNGS